MACEVERRLMWMAAGQGSAWMVELFACERWLGLLVGLRAALTAPIDSSKVA